MARKAGKVTSEVKDLWNRVLAAEEYHKTEFVGRAEQNIKFLRGDTSYLPKDFEYDVINPNLIFSTIRTYVPALYPINPKVFVKPRGPEWGEKKKDNVYSAFVAQSILDYYQYELEMKKTDKQVILGSLVYGLSYVMDAWVTEKGNVNPTILKDQPMHRFVSGIDIIPDPEGLEFEDKSFVARTYGKSLKQMKNMGYQNIDVEKDYGSDYGIDPQTRKPKLPKFYEIWDKETEQVYTMSDFGGAETLHEKRDFSIEDGFPFTPLIFNPMIDKFYPMSLVEQLVTMQKFITLMVSYGARHAKMAVPKIIGFKEYFDAQSLRALQSGKIDDFIALSQKGDNKMSIEQIVTALRLPGLPADFYNMMNIVRDFMNVISGVSENARGGGQTSETATGAAIVDTYLRSRIGDYKGITDDFIVDSRRKMMKVVKRNASSEKYLRFNKIDLYNEYFYPKPTIPGGEINPMQLPGPQRQFYDNTKEQGSFVFVPWKKDEISGEYDFSLGVGAGLPANEESTYKRALQNFNIMVNDPAIDKNKLHLYFLRELGIPDAEAWIAPPPQPQPEKPKMSISLSMKGEELPPEAQEQVLNQLGLAIPESAGPSGNGRISPADVGLQRELGLMGGLQNPPNMPEINGGNNG